MTKDTNQKIEKDLEEKSLTLHEKALAIKIIDQGSYTEAGEFFKPLKDLEKQIIDHYKPMKEAAFEAHRTITAKEAADLKPVREAMQIIRGAMNKFLSDQEAARKKEEAKNKELAEAATLKEKGKLQKQAERADEKGLVSRAEELREKAENVYVPPVTSAPITKTKTENVTVSAAMETVVNVRDLKAFITELVKRNLPPTMIDIKAAALKSWVKLNDFESFPGLEIQKVPKARIR